jgi:hypothetical protein
MEQITAYYTNHPWRSFLVTLLIVVVVGMAGFLMTVYGSLKPGDDPGGKLIEAGNYATQTVTTVGYGNMEFADSRAQRRLKLFSSFYTVFSALAWVLMVHRAVGGR